MPKYFALILLLALMGACSKPTPGPEGIAQLDEVQSLAERFVLHGESGAILAHLNLDGVPPDAAQKARITFEKWRGVPDHLKHTGTQVLSFTEYEAQRREDKKDLSEEMRNALLSGIRWNVTPEKLIVFTFGSKDPKDTTTIVRWSAGAYQSNGLWYFAASYIP
ncbi:hypothetical protein [Verrucomicrobium sp. BvORR106]|uniref:hypothetical protein n=1 Tax=Verrucomicrobium sp. BvORR106 TaxID=1403819 RepID=UPI00056DBC0C|nr:hypothetical protein [Verrucomicrobium sp. BvORR106]